jgi:hypothetical protein
MKPPGVGDDPVEKSGHRHNWSGQLLVQERGQSAFKPFGRSRYR